MQEKVKILFVCHGNICRSPMAEFVLKDIVNKAGANDRFHIESAATSTEAVGCSIYPPAYKQLKKHNIGTKDNELGVGKKKSRQITSNDYDEYDYLIVMEEYQKDILYRKYGGDPDEKIYKLLDFTDEPYDVDDPWYTRDFDRTWDEILLGCKRLYEKVK